MSTQKTPVRRGTATRRPRATLLGLAGLGGLLVLTHAPAHGGQARATGPVALASASYDWLQIDGGPQHSGDNTRETTLTPATVARLRPLFTVALPGIADGAPILLRAVPTAHGTRDLLFLTTTDGHIVARDARTGAAVWAHQYGPGACRINNVGDPCYTTSSRDGHSYLYASNGGYPGDQGDYQGHVTVIDLANGAQRVFNTDCSDRAVHFAEAPGTPDCPAVRGAVWARPTVVYDAATDRIYLGVARGTFNPARHDWADSILALRPDGTGVAGGPLDSYTPATYLQLDAADHDLGSTSPALLPVPRASRVRRLAAQAGKDGLLRLLDLDNLSVRAALAIRAARYSRSVGRRCPHPPCGRTRATGASGCSWPTIKGSPACASPSMVGSRAYARCGRTPAGTEHRRSWPTVCSTRRAARRCRRSAPRRGGRCGGRGSGPSTGRARSWPTACSTWPTGTRRCAPIASPGVEGTKS